MLHVYKFLLHEYVANVANHDLPFFTLVQVNWYFVAYDVRFCYIDVLKMLQPFCYMSQTLCLFKFSYT